MKLRTIEWKPDGTSSLTPGNVRMIDQTLLPEELVVLELVEVEEVWQAIKTLKVRGAPAIGVAAAMGVVLGAQKAEGDLVAAVRETADVLATSRPTAQNLFWALDRMRRVAEEGADDLLERLAREAMDIRDEDEAQCRAIGEHGVALLTDGQSVLTHCNAGSLATAAYGTALAPIY
ncbi:MAG: S-methyl-5-thioribose-1-phosphate isomerase, partial [Verrucomicrobiota bacterium]